MPDEDQTFSGSLMPTLLGVAIVLLVLATILIVSLARRSTGGLDVPAGYNVVHVDEYSYGFRLPSTTLPAGNTLFVARNVSDIPHEFVLFKTDTPADKLPLKADRTADEESPDLEAVIDSGSAFGAGETRLLTGDLEPGHYVLICNLPPNHLQAGMRVDVTVK